MFRADPGNQIIRIFSSTGFDFFSEFTIQFETIVLKPKVLYTYHTAKKIKNKNVPKITIYNSFKVLFKMLFVPLMITSHSLRKLTLREIKLYCE